MTLQVNIPRYGNVFYNADTFADLRAVPTTLIQDGYSTIVKGASAPADGFGGMLVWNPASTAADDNRTVIAPADGGTGRWIKIATGVPGPQGAIGPQGIQGIPGASNNTFTSYSALQSSDPTRRYAYLANDTDSPPHPDGPYTNPTQTVGGWLPQPADGIAYKTRLLPATLDEMLYVENFRGAGYSDLQTIRAAFAALQVSGTGTLVFGKGRKYDLGTKTDAASVFSLQSGLNGAVIDFNGATITIAFSGGVVFNVFDIGNYTNVRFCNGNFVDSSYVVGVVAGACWITPQPGSQTCRGLTIDNLFVNGGVAAVQPKGPSAPYRIVGIHLGANCAFRNVYYGVNCQEQGDEMSGAFSVTNPVRAYFVYGCSGHDVAVNIMSDGLATTETLVLIKRYTRTTNNIRVRVRLDGVIPARNAIVKLEHQNDDGAASVVDNIDVQINLAASATDPNGVPRLAFRSYSAAGVEITGTSAQVTSNVRLSGDLIGTTTGALSFTAATTNGSAVITPAGLYNNLAVDYFSPGATITGPNIQPDTIVVSTSGGTVTLSNAATATATSAALTRSAIDIRSHYTPLKECRIALDPAIRGGTPTRTSAFRGFCFRVARDREYRLFRGDLTTAGLPIDLSGLDNASTMIGVGAMFVGNQSGATAQDRTYYEFNIFLTIPPGGPIAVNSSPNPINSSNGAAATFGGFTVSGKLLQLNITGGAYALATSFARIDTTYRDQVPT